MLTVPTPEYEYSFQIFEKKIKNFIIQVVINDVHLAAFAQDGSVQLYAGDNVLDGWHIII